MRNPTISAARPRRLSSLLSLKRPKGHYFASLTLLTLGGSVFWMVLSQVFLGYSHFNKVAPTPLEDGLIQKSAWLLASRRSSSSKRDDKSSPSEFLSIPFRPDDDELKKPGMAVCLIYMDDNHYLVEWLAYHYHYLPLRRLIVAIDPKSTTSPLAILNRYQNNNDNNQTTTTTFINITVWNDDDFLFDKSRSTVQRIMVAQSRLPEAKGNPIVAEYLTRQLIFQSACLKQLKAENQSWVALIDTDEYLVVNSQATTNHPRITERKPTILEMLESSPIHRNGSSSSSSSISSTWPPCIPMNRFNIGVHEESNVTLAQDGFPATMNDEGDKCDLSPLNYTDFFTFRWRYPGETSGVNQLPGKCLVDLSRVAADRSSSVLSPMKMSPHRPIYDICPKSARYPDFETSTFVLHQYVGSYDQWTYRKDSRSKRFQRQDAYQELDYTKYAPTDSARFWLHEFVQQHGCQRAKELLQGAGQLA